MLASSMLTSLPVADFRYNAAFGFDFILRTRRDVLALNDEAFVEAAVFLVSVQFYFAKWLGEKAA